MSFWVGFVLGAVVAWLLVSWFYFEHLKRRGLIDERGAWIDQTRPAWTLPVEWEPGTFKTVAEHFTKQSRAGRGLGACMLWATVAIVSLAVAGILVWVALILLWGGG